MQAAQVIPFSFEKHPIRATVINGDPWFVASDICRALKLTNTSESLRNLDDDEKGISSTETPSGMQEMLVINESGLFTLILRCRNAVKPGTDPHRFRKWVTAEVLPAIRKHGRYEDTSGKMDTLLNSTIGTDGFHMLGAVLDGKLRHLPKKRKTSVSQHIWAQIHKAFGVSRGQDIPVNQLDSARNFIAAYNVHEGEFLGKEPEPEVQARLNIHYPIESLTSRRPEMIRGCEGAYDDLKVTLDDFDSNRESFCEEILHTLSNAGYKVEAAWFEIRTYRNKLDDINKAMSRLNFEAESPLQFLVKKA